MVKCVALIFVLLQVASGQTWVVKVSATSTVLGNALASNPLDSRIIYAVPGGKQMYVSRDRGYTWLPYGNPVPQEGSQKNVIKSIAVNPRDTLQIVVGVESSNSSFDRVMKSTDGGASWTATWGGSFSYYGKPVEFKPVHPDTMYTMGNDTIWRSTNFGSTWGVVRTTTGLFNAWCDAEIRPDSGNIMFLGDYTTGIWKTADHGHTWRKVFATDGEVPSIAIDPFHPRIMYATRFAGGGGVVKSTDGGESWNSLTTPIGAGPGWWITCSTVDTGYVYFGVYGANPGGIFVSADYGGSWRNMNAGLGPSSLINYGLLALDTLTVLASQINGLWRLQYPISVHVVSPNGGEVLHGGAASSISWTGSNLYSVRIAYSTDNGGSWTTIGDSIVPAQSPYPWIPPQVTSAACRVRVSDDLQTFVSDVSDTAFTIYVEPLALHHPAGGERWSAGSRRNIDWLAYGIQFVRLEYSTDGGADWNYIARVPAPAGTYRWVVPNSPSENCRVRIADAGDTALSRVSDSVFAITRTAAFNGTLHITDNGANQDSLTFGAEIGATDGIDSALGETPLPLKPGNGNFDVRWKIPSGPETKIDIRDTLTDVDPEDLFIVEIQPGPAGYPMTLSWNPESLSAGTFILRDTATHGGMYNVDMRNSGTVTVVDPSVSAVEIVHCRGFWYTFSGNGGWLLMSMPVDVGDWRRTSLFPNAVSNAFAYRGGYQRADTLGHGLGYWLKSDQATVIGCPRTSDTVALAAGWNIIGALSSPVAVSSLVVVPDTLLTSNFYGYDQHYTVADSIRQGGGYWIRTRGSGRLILSSGTVSSSKQSAAFRPLDGFHGLTVTDEKNHRQELYFGVQKPGINVDFYDLPPPPPEGGFDVRFASRGMLAAHPAQLQVPVEFPIRISTVSSRLKFSWSIANEKKYSYILLEKLGDKEVGEMRLAGDGSAAVQLADQVTVTLRAQAGAENAQIPGAYSLDPMYPNPFNPLTHFSYALPSDARVSIRVYSILGAEVTRLVDGIYSAGMYNADWAGTSADGNPVSSGVYYIRMTAAPTGGATGSFRASFAEVRKVLLIR